MEREESRGRRGTGIRVNQSINQLIDIGNIGTAIYHNQTTIIHTFRVDSCSKHLLAAPLIVQNVDAWNGQSKDNP